jgi:WXG100 family type VII secretion target
MGDALVYNFDGINTVAGQVAAFTADMNAQLADVDKTFQNLLADGWQGAGANAFQGASVAWHKSADQMTQTLQQLAQKVGNAAVNMQQADQAAAARF